MLGKLMKARTKVREVHTLGLTMPDADYARLRAAAAMRDRSISGLTRLIIIEWLDDEDRLDGTMKATNASPAPARRAATKRVKGP